jgi:hypothetical protein
MGVQDFFVLSQNPIPAITLTNLKLGLGYLNVYSDCPQIPLKAINSKGLRVKTGVVYIVLLQEKSEIQFCI